MEDEPPALQHIRNYSNYLFPDGAMDLLYNASIYARGLVVNAVLVAPVCTRGIGAHACLLCVRDAQFWPTIAVWHPFGLKHFFFISGPWPSFLSRWASPGGSFARCGGQPAAKEIPGQWTKPVGWLVIGFFVVAFCELQPFVLDAMLGADIGDISLSSRPMGKDPFGDIGACRGGHGFPRQQAWRIRQERHASAESGAPNQSSCHEGGDLCRWAHPSASWSGWSISTSPIGASASTSRRA